MSRLRTERKRMLMTRGAEPNRITEDTVKQQLSAAVGTENFQNRDPIYHLTESFRQTFDLMGQQRVRGQQPDADAMAQTFMGAETPGIAQETPRSSGEGEFSLDLLHKTSMTSQYEPRDRDPNSHLMRRFADVSFQRGVLSGAVIRGTGKMMLFSCLERTVGQDKAQPQKERKLFQRNSSHRKVPGGGGDVAITNKGFSRSAVGLVVDTLKDARRVMDSFTTLVEKKGPGAETLYRQYPFLTDDAERDLLAQYRARLKELRGPGHEEEREVLKGAQEKVEAIIAKKDQMKRDFLQRLRYLQRSAMEAEQLFSSDAFLEEVRRRFEPEEAEDPPEPPEDGEGGDDKPRKRG